MLRRTVLHRAGGNAVAMSWADPTEDDLRLEIRQILEQKEKDNPMECSLAVLGAGMLGDLVLYEWGKKLITEDLGIPSIGEIIHGEADVTEMWRVIEEATASFDEHPGPVDLRLWMLGRLVMAAGFMCDETTAAVSATLLQRKLNKPNLTVPELWACGYHLQHAGRRTRNSEDQKEKRVGGVHRARSPYGAEVSRTSKLVKSIPPADIDPGSYIWAKIMLIHGACSSGETEMFSRFKWCLDLTHLPVSDYKAWGYAMICHAAACTDNPEEAFEYAQRAMEILRQVDPANRAPHEAMLTLLQLRTAFIDLHRCDPKLSKKAAKHCTPNLPFVVKGKPPRMLGVPRYVAFPLEEYTPKLLDAGYVLSGL
eukprot:TRINITY_DN7487_c0_g1_i7.p1 TRINITY_DN7487_c0_g1~~TRINITY_DN7487_c0_g1_i7.p1  ORF type:complete len:367 (+),score=78.21 TRINITY_DN7487_c0_g1_i7:35-1135(+)